MSHYVLDARAATPHFPGIGRYVTNLARAMTPLLGADERLTVIVDPAHPFTLPPSPAVQTVPLDVSLFSLAQQWAVPYLLRSLHRAPVTSLQPPRFNLQFPVSSFQSSALSLYHSPYIAMPYRPGTPTLLTVYDLIPLRYPEHSTARARLLIRWMTRLALRTARHVIAISDFTRRDFMAEFRLPPERITAIPLAADPAFAPQPSEEAAAVRRKYDLPERFVLYLGSNKPHKNLAQLVEAWLMANGRWQMAGGGLVIAGAWDERYPEARNLAGIQHPASSIQRLVWLGAVPETDLPALYSAATVFVFPSLYEGFGLPVLEAMACGTPVICSNTSSLPEAAGDAAVLVAPTDRGALADALCHVLSDDHLRAKLRERGLAQAQRFSWQVTAQKTLQCYRATVSGQKPTTSTIALEHMHEHPSGLPFDRPRI